MTTVILIMSYTLGERGPVFTYRTRRLGQQRSVYVMYHGTKSANVESVLCNGLHERYCDPYASMLGG